MKRKYSEKYIDSEIAKIDKMNEESMIPFFDPLPYQHTLGEHGIEVMNKYIKELINRNRKMAHVAGFWQGWTLREGLKEEKS